MVGFSVSVPVVRQVIGVAPFGRSLLIGLFHRLRSYMMSRSVRHLGGGFGLSKSVLVVSKHNQFHSVRA